MEADHPRLAYFLNLMPGQLRVAIEFRNATWHRDSTFALLEEHGVVVAHGSAYGEGGEGTLRVSFASGGQNLANGLERLRTGLAAL